MPEIQITWKCNQNCINCILDSEVLRNSPDPSLEKIYQFIDSLDEEKDYVALTGGEPTIDKRLPDILKYIKETKPNLRTQLVTNGMMLSYRRLVKAIKANAPENFYVAIAMYGHNPKLHDSHTRTPGSFYATLLGIKNSILEGLWTEVRFIITRLNYRYLPDIAWFVADEFPEVQRVVFLNMKYTGNALKYKDILFVRESEVVPYATRAVDILSGHSFAPWYDPPYHYHEVRLYHFPLCILPEKYWVYAEGVTKFDDDVIFLDKCEKCAVKDRCPKIWKSYVEIAGDEEFSPIT